MLRRLINILGVVLLALLLFKADLFADRSSDIKAHSAVSTLPILGVEGDLGSFYTHLRDVDRANILGLMMARSQVSIVHIGDSYIQAGYVTGQIRRRFQDRFGDAGRGLVVPLKLASTNEPSDYLIKSPKKWKNSLITRHKDYQRAGIGGISIYGSDAPIEIQTLTNGVYPLSKFDEITIYHSPQSGEVTTNSLYDLGIRCQDTIYGGISTTIALADAVDSVELLSDGDMEYYGFDLRSSNPGVVYHSIGVNGACYFHYGRNGKTLDYISRLDPALVVISMGINEAHGSRFTKAQFYLEIDKAVDRVRSNNPNSNILLVTPPPTYRKGSENSNIPLAAETIREYVQEHELALVDLYKACKKSGRFTIDSPLYGSDKIHLTLDGYAALGDMVYEAIEAGYDNTIWW